MPTKKSEFPSASDADAIALLLADHKRVKALFKEFAAARKDEDDTERKRDLVAQVCRALRIHTELEEEIFYPAVREQIGDSDLMDEALVEHAGAKELVRQLEGMDPEDELYDAKVTVLGEQIDHHVKEEEGEMFPKAKKAKVDTAELGTQMAQRKAALEESLDEGNGSGRRGVGPTHATAKAANKSRS
jgi:hemerythrin superfamily protein